MAGYIICISQVSGVPIFARRIGNVDAIPFSLAATLYGIKAYGSEQRLQLLSTLTCNARVIWKDYGKSLSLIFVGSNDTGSNPNHLCLLDNVHNSLLFFLGSDYLENINSIEKFKKECRKVYPVIDKYLYGLNPQEHTGYFGDLTGTADIALSSDIQSSFQNNLEELLEKIDCKYGALIANGSIIAASREWWCLRGSENCLLTFVATQESSEQYSDSPIYLPLTSPKRPFRLVTYRTKWHAVQLAILCGKDPETNFLRTEICKWKLSLDHKLLEQKEAFTAMFNHMRIDFRRLQGYLLVHEEKEKSNYWINRDSHGVNNEYADLTTTSFNLLRSFFRSTLDLVSLPSLPDPHILETYWMLQSFKVHAIVSTPCRLFVLYRTGMELTEMRRTSRKLLLELTRDKIFKI